MKMHLAKLVLASLICIGVSYYFYFSPVEQQTIDRSIGWHVTTGKLLYHSDEIGGRTADNMLMGPLGWLSFIAAKPAAVYKYTVNGQEFTQTKTSSVPTITAVRMYVNKEAFEIKTKAPKEMSAKSQAAVRDRFNRYLNGQARFGELLMQSEAEFEDWRPSVSVRYNPVNPKESELDPSALKSSDAIKDTGAILMVVGFVGLFLLCLHETLTNNEADPMLNLDTAIVYYKKQGTLPARYR